MAFSLVLLLPIALLLIVGIVMVISGKGIARGLGALILMLFVLGGLGILTGAPVPAGAKFQGFPVESLVPQGPGTGALTVFGTSRQGQQVSRLSGVINERLERAELLPPDGEQYLLSNRYSWYASKFMGKDQVELYHPFHIKSGTDLEAVRALVRGALIEVLAEDQGDGLETLGSLTIDLRLVGDEGSGLQSFALSVENGGATWVPSDSSRVLVKYLGANGPDGSVPASASASAPENAPGVAPETAPEASKEQVSDSEGPAPAGS